MRDAEKSWIPYVIIVGKKEATSDQLAVRRRTDGKQYTCTLAELEREISCVHARIPSNVSQTAIVVKQETRLQTGSLRSDFS